MKNLGKANQILQKITAQIPEITPISPNDLPLFQKFFSREPHTYGNSWTYVTQGMYGTGPHNLGYKYYDGKNLSAVTVYPKIEKPDLHVFYWVRPMGETILDVIARLANHLLTKQSLPTYVKKIFSIQFAYLQKKGFKDTANFPWHTLCHSEDDTYPEQIYDVAAISKLLSTPPRTSNIRKSYRKAKQIEKKHSLLIKEDNFITVAWDITQCFFDSKLIKNNKVNVSDAYDYHNPIFANPPRKQLKKRIYYIDGKPLGYYLEEKQNDLHTSMYALIILRDQIEYLTDYIMFDLFNKCETEFLNLGGSEDKGIHFFKKKFKPIKEVKMFWATNYSG